MVIKKPILGELPIVESISDISPVALVGLDAANAFNVHCVGLGGYGDGVNSDRHQRAKMVVVASPLRGIA